MTTLLNRIARKLFAGNAIRKPVRRPSVRLGVEALEERWCPAITSTWTGAGANWNNAANWTNGVPSQSGDTAIFNGTYNAGIGNANCTVNMSPTCAIQFINGYNKTVTVNAVEVLTIDDIAETSDANPTISMTSDATHPAFTDIQDSCTFKAITFTTTGTQLNGVLDVNSSGTLYLGTVTNNGVDYTNNISCAVKVESGGLLVMGDSNNITTQFSPVTFTPTNASVQNIVVNGEMDIWGHNDNSTQTILKDGSGTVPVLIQVAESSTYTGNLSLICKNSSATDEVQAYVVNYGSFNMNNNSSYAASTWKLTGVASGDTIIEQGLFSVSDVNCTTNLAQGTLTIKGDFIQNSWTGNETITTFGRYSTVILNSNSGDTDNWVFNGGTLRSYDYAFNATNDYYLNFNATNTIVFGISSVNQDPFQLDIDIDLTTGTFYPVKVSSGSSTSKISIGGSPYLHVASFGTGGVVTDFVPVYMNIASGGISGSFPAANETAPTSFPSGTSTWTFGQIAKEITLTAS